MKTTIYIKSYKRDLPWLEYCAKSIEKYCTGFHNILLVLDEGMEKPNFIPDEWEIHYWPKYKKCAGYLQQQIAKMSAHLISKKEPEAILYVDSDSVFNTPCTPNNWTHDNKPILLKKSYAKLAADRISYKATCWRPITKNITGIDVQYEYMRRMPIIFKTETIELTRRTILDKLRKIILGEIKEFSEFNAIGAIAELHHSQYYTIIDEDQNPELIPPNTANQYYSWGGITPEIKEQIEKILY
jgi:hypothetical protein